MMSIDGEKKKMKLSAALRAFSERIGYSFHDNELLIKAVTHSSFSTVTRSDNQRLEFLGDRVLGLVIAQFLLDQDPNASEGILAPRFNAMVRKETCAEVARKINLGDILKLGNSEMISGGRKKEAILGDSMEALIAAVYLDGGFEVARKFILNFWKGELDKVELDAKDAKTALQEFSQSLGHSPPLYKVVEKSGPDHAPIFKVSVSIKSGEMGVAVANSKRKAEQGAAKKLLDGIKNE
jgi:ribonuclease-3